MPSTTLWTKGAGDDLPLYSDWTVSFTAIGNSCLAKKDAGSVSTASLSSEEDNKDQDRDESSFDISEDQRQDEDQREEFFSVHRNMIGPKSMFFTQSFQGKIETKNANSSVIELPSNMPSHTFDSVVEAFELLLDYCYNGNENSVTESKLVTENAVAMFCLCNHFGMNSEICDKVMDFIKSDLSHDTVAKYYQIIKDMQSAAETPLILDTKPIMEMVVTMCHEDPSALDSETDLFKIADLSLWLSVGSLLAGDDNDKVEFASKVWSENLTSFFDAYNEEDILKVKDSFRILTAENVLPEISSKVALRLLEHESKYGQESLSHSDGLSHTTSNITEDGTTSVSEDSDIEMVHEEDLQRNIMLTNLQQRCIRAMCDSNWSGEENHVELKRGKLVDITTPAVLEALLLDSVAGNWALTANMEEMEASLDKKKAVLTQEIELFEFKQGESKFEVAREKQKQLKLQHKLDATRKECETLECKLKMLEKREEKDKAELCKANAVLEAELEKEKKKSFTLNGRYREIETAQFRLESDRENYELTIKEAIKQLEVITTYDEPYGACGLGYIILLLSSIGDRKECEQIKTMLQQVIKDPQTYERDFLLKNKTDEEVTDSDSFMTHTTGDISRL